MPQTRRILYIENDKDSCDLLKTLFSFEGLVVTTCESAEDALEMAQNNRYSAIVLEYRLASMSGTDLCRRIREFDPDTPIVFYSASAFPSERQDGFAAGADDYLVKPNDFERLTDVVSGLAESHGRPGDPKAARAVSPRPRTDRGLKFDVNRLPAPAANASTVGFVSIMGH
jgi:DNA-binding response OmpR family regulator